MKSAVVLQLIRSRYSEYYINIILNTGKLATALNIHSKALFSSSSLYGVLVGVPSSMAGQAAWTLVFMITITREHLLIISDKFKSQ